MTVIEKALAGVAAAWRLEGDELVGLVGSPPDRERSSYLLGIYGGLASIFGDQPIAHEWVRRPNADFTGSRPLDVMLDGDLAGVRSYIDAWQLGCD